jgi:hypothetical protein
MPTTCPPTVLRRRERVDPIYLWVSGGLQRAGSRQQELTARRSFFFSPVHVCEKRMFTCAQVDGSRAVWRRS